MIERRIARPLTDDEFEAVENGIKEAESLDEVLVSAMKLTFDPLLRDLGESWDDYSPERRIRPGDFALPVEQCRAIIGFLLERGKELDPIGRVNLGLSWINIGPGSYENEEERIRCTTAS